jgi:hypothetical protein
MASWLNQRNAAMGGFLAMVLLVVGQVIYGRPPKFSASQGSVVDFYTQHHRTVLIGLILIGVAIPLYVWFIAYLAVAVGGALGAAVALGALLVAAAAGVGDVLSLTLSRSITAGSDSGAIRLAYEGATLAYTRLFWAAIAVAIPLAIAASKGALRSWVVWVAWLQAILMLLGGLSLKTTGFFSPVGGMATIAYAAYFIGTAAFALALWQASPTTVSAPRTA